jgi:competence protein ComGC
MKKLIHKFRKALRSNRGETIMESLASLFLMSILLMAITMMIQTSQQMTIVATTTATDVQENIINSAILGDYDGDKPLVVTLKNAVPDAGAYIVNISASHQVRFTDEGGVVAFAP